MILEHLVMTESKKVAKKSNRRKPKPKNVWESVKRTLVFSLYWPAGGEH